MTTKGNGQPLRYQLIMSEQTKAKLPLFAPLLPGNHITMLCCYDLHKLHGAVTVFL